MPDLVAGARNLCCVEFVGRRLVDERATPAADDRRDAIESRRCREERATSRPD